jgi:hypothetical protein
MSTLREAAQQALEALKDCVKALDALHAPGDSIYTRASDSADRAEIALRDALERQTQTPCDMAEDGVCEVIDCCRNRSLILEALEIGYDAAKAEAAQYHAAMAGYRPERHVEMDADVAKIAKAITALRAALAQDSWQPIATAPKTGRKVILSYLNRHSLPRTVMARWVTDEEAAETDGEGVGLEAGWYECIDNWDYTEVAIYEGEPTHWMPLPEAPRKEEA